MTSPDQPTAPTSAPTEEKGHWWCADCKEIVPPEHVTNSEHHDERCGGCGFEVQWMDNAKAAPSPQAALGVRPGITKCVKCGLVGTFEQACVCGDTPSLLIPSIPEGTPPTQPWAEAAAREIVNGIQIKTDLMPVFSTSSQPAGIRSGEVRLPDITAIILKFAPPDLSAARTEATLWQRKYEGAEAELVRLRQQLELLGYTEPAQPSSPDAPAN